MYSAQFTVKMTVFIEDNHPVLHLQGRHLASASYFEKTIVPVLKKTILLEKTILPFPSNDSSNVRHFVPQPVKPEKEKEIFSDKRV